MNFGATLINPTTLLNPSAKGADESSKSPRTRSTTWPSQRSPDLRPGGPAAIVARGKLGREKTRTIAVNLSEQAAAWSAQDALADRLYREGDFLFESVEGVCSENRGGSLPGRRMVATLQAGNAGSMGQ